MRRIVIFVTLLLAIDVERGRAQTTIAGSVATTVGSTWPALGTTATSQTIDAPSAVISDGTGGFYLASPNQNRVYRVSASGTLSVLAGTGISGFSGDGGDATTARLTLPVGLAADFFGNVYIADYGNSRVRRVNSAGVIATVAGNGSSGFAGDGGLATSAGMRPTAVAVDTTGSLFIVDYNNSRVRKLSPSGTITTVAGNGTHGFGGDGGPATAASMTPNGLAIDPFGNLFIVDSDNGRIRKVNPAGIISTVAGDGTNGFGGDGGPATQAALAHPDGVAVDNSGNIFIADWGNSRIRRVFPSGIITTIAGSSSYGFAGDNGPATAAQLFGPEGVALDANGYVYIADTLNNRIRVVTAGGVITTAAGNGTAIFDLNGAVSGGFSGDGGPAAVAQLQNPSAVAADSAGNLFIADSYNARVRKVTAGGVISTVAGAGTVGFSGDGGPATSAGISPWGIAVDGAGNLFISDSINNRVRRVTAATGLISTVAGTGIAGFGGDSGPAVSAMLNQPTGLALDAAGNLLIADTGNSRIRKVTAAGIITTLAGSGTAGLGGDGGPSISAKLNRPMGVAVDRAGNLFIADSFNHRIRKVNPLGLIITVAGSGSTTSAGSFGGDGGAATASLLSLPGGVAVDSVDNVYIADTGNARIRRVDSAGIITTIAGSGAYGFGGDGGDAASAQFALALCCAVGLAVDPSGNLLVPDYGNNRIRKVTFTQQSLYTTSNQGGISLSSSGTLPATVVGYAAIQPNVGSNAPAGVAIFGYRQGGILLSEAGVPASPLITSGRIYAEMNGAVNTGLAIANPNNVAAILTFFFTTGSGNLGSNTTTIPANGQLARFLDQAPFNGVAPLSGTFSFTSSVPVAVVALRGLTNERAEFLITTLAVADLTAPASTAPIVFPHFADGGGWTTQVVVVNPTESPLTGTVQFLNPSGGPATVVVNQQSANNFSYSVPARSSQKLQTSSATVAIAHGSVRVVPTANQSTPSALLIFSFRKDGITVAEAGVPATAAGTAFRLYAEVSNSIQTGIAAANASGTAATVTFELTRLDGTALGLIETLTLPANGQIPIFLNELPAFRSLPASFQGVLRLTSSSPITVIGLRSRYNERNDFLITTTPPVSEFAPSSSTPVYFPHIADSGGYTTQFILFSAQPGLPSSGTMQFFSQTGGAFNLVFQ